MSRNSLLKWRKPTDHPQDHDSGKTLLVAEGFGGRYSIEPSFNKFILWSADDEFHHQEFESVEDCKKFAEDEFQARLESLTSKHQYVLVRSCEIGDAIETKLFSKKIDAFNYCIKKFCINGGDWEPYLTVPDPEGEEYREAGVVKRFRYVGWKAQLIDETWLLIHEIEVE